MATANDLVSGALRAATSLSPGEGIPGAESDIALGILNSMMASWSADALMPPYRTLESFTLSTTKNSYTMGQSGSPDVSTVRPDQVTFVFRRDSSNQDYPLDPYTKEQYNSVPLKSRSDTPRYYFYDTQYPNGVLYLDCKPSAADTLFVESLKPLNQFSSLAASVALPGEYEEAVKYLLCERLSPEYGFPISADLRKLIEDARRRIYRKNARPKAAGFDVALRDRPYPGYGRITAG